MRGFKLILFENEHYKIISEYEVVTLVNKVNENHTIIGDFYGDPAAAIISDDCKFCVVVGCGVIIYYIMPPFADYSYKTKNTQWLEFMRDGDLWFDSVIQTDSAHILVCGENDLTLQINVYSGELETVKKNL